MYLVDDQCAPVHSLLANAVKSYVLVKNWTMQHIKYADENPESDRGCIERLLAVHITMKVHCKKRRAVSISKWKQVGTHPS